MSASIAIIQFPGSNTERETLMACRRVGLNPVEFLWNEPAEKLLKFNGFVIVGGFAYEDRSRAGVIAALDPIMDQIKIYNKHLNFKYFRLLATKGILGFPFVVLD